LSHFLHTGVVDSDFRGEIGVVVTNLGPKTVVLEKGDRFAQLVVHHCPRIVWTPAKGIFHLGHMGFGSSGITKDGMSDRQTVGRLTEDDQATEDPLNLVRSKQGPKTSKVKPLAAASQQPKHAVTKLSMSVVS